MSCKRKEVSPVVDAADGGSPIYDDANDTNSSGLPDVATRMQNLSLDDDDDAEVDDNSNDNQGNNNINDNILGELVDYDSSGLEGGQTPPSLMASLGSWPTSESSTTTNERSPDVEYTWVAPKRMQGVSKYFLYSTALNSSLRPIRARCRLCRDPTVLSYSGNISNLRKHLHNHHPSLYADVTSKLMSGDLLNSLVTAMITAGLPFNTLQGPHWENFWRLLAEHYDAQRAYIPPSRHLLRSAMDRVYDMVHSQLLRQLFLAKVIRLIHDVWESDGIHYCGVLAFGLDRFYRSFCCILSLKPLDPESRKDAKYLASIVNEVIDSYPSLARMLASRSQIDGVVLRVPHFVVSDGAAVNGAALRHLRLSECVGFSCGLHMMNNSVLAAFRLVPDAEYFLGEIEGFINLINNNQAMKSSITRRDFVLRAAGNTGFHERRLKTRAVTRWGSSYKVLERFLSMSEAIMEVVHEATVRGDLKKKKFAENGAQKERRWASLLSFVSTLGAMSKLSTLVSVMMPLALLMKTFQDHDVGILAALHWSVNDVVERVRKGIFLVVGDRAGPELASGIRPLTTLDVDRWMSFAGDHPLPEYWRMPVAFAAALIFSLKHRFQSQMSSEERHACGTVTESTRPHHLAPRPKGKESPAVPMDQPSNKTFHATSPTASAVFHWVPLHDRTIYLLPEEREAAKWYRAISMLDPRIDKRSMDDREAVLDFYERLRVNAEIPSSSEPAPTLSSSQRYNDPFSVINQQHRKGPSSVREEMEQFFMMPPDNHVSDVRDWWFERLPKFPQSKELIRLLLCVPASSASVESFFSRCKKQKGDTQLSMSTETLSRRCFIAFNSGLFHESSHRGGLDESADAIFFGSSHDSISQSPTSPFLPALTSSGGLLDSPPSSSPFLSPTPTSLPSWSDVTSPFPSSLLPPPTASSAAVATGRTARKMLRKRN